MKLINKAKNVDRFSKAVYARVKSVKIVSDNEIIIESASNNVVPKIYHKFQFTGTLIDFIKYVSGNLYQIAPSANSYFWGAFLPIFKKSLEAYNIDFDNLYYLDSSNQRWNDIVKTFNVAMNYLKANRNKKCYVRSGSFYIAGRAYGSRYYLVENKEDAKKYPYCQARYMSENNVWTFEEAR